MCLVDDGAVPVAFGTLSLNVTRAGADKALDPRKRARWDLQSARWTGKEKYA